MSTFLFIFGKDHELSLAELKAVYPEAAIQQIGREYVMVDLSEEFTQKHFDRLGGMIKAARFLAFTKNIPQTLFESLSGRYQDKKLLYGISVYDYAESNLRGILKELKMLLKEAGIKSRFLNQDFHNLSAAHYKGLGREGVEFVVVRSPQGFVIGEVVAAQDIDAYSKRDYGKPYRSMKTGMLPPKLAQILINLTGLREGRIWDPFCGTGSLVMEGLLMGYDMLGSDIDAQVLNGARQNAEWLGREFRVTQQADLFSHDARRPLTGRTFDAIAAEGHLGPPQSRRLSIGQLQPLVLELEELYFLFFKSLHEIKFKGPVVLAMPFFRTSEGDELFLGGAIQQVKQLGFEVSGPLTYARPDQIVGRAIYRFAQS